MNYPKPEENEHDDNLTEQEPQDDPYVGFIRHDNDVTEIHDNSGKVVINATLLTQERGEFNGVILMNPTANQIETEVRFYSFLSQGAKHRKRFANKPQVAKHVMNFEGCGDTGIAGRIANNSTNTAPPKYLG